MGRIRIRVRLFCVLIALVGFHQGQAQSVYLLRHMGGNFISDPVYRVELFNPASRAQNLSGYLLITRQFVARLPAGTRIGPRQRLIFSKTPLPSSADPVIPFENIPDFLVRIPQNTAEGDYLVLLDRSKNVRDAFFYAPSRRVSFLPDTGSLITFSQRRIPFSLPAETNRVWQYLALTPDPAIAFMRVEGRWQAGSRTRNTFPATAYGEPEASYSEEVVSLRVKTLFERDALEHRLERSEDRQKVVVVEKVAARGSPSSYQVYDPGVKPGKQYYYRFTHRDRFGFEVSSAWVELRTEEGDAALTLEPFVTGVEGARQLNVRIFTREADPLRLKVVDELGRQWAVRFYESLQAGNRYLMRFEAVIPEGRYRIIASTPSRRYYRAFMVE